VLFLTTDLARGWLADRRERKVAARLIFGEIVVNFAGMSALAAHGELPGGIRQVAWDAFGAKLVRSLDAEDLMRVVQGYSSFADVAWAASDQEFDPVKDEYDAKFVKAQMQYAHRAFRIVGRLAGYAPDEIERRLKKAEAIQARVEKERAAGNDKAPGEPN
jgi:hypothetical protein